MKKLAWLLIAAAACWILSEGLEFTSGGRIALTLFLTVAFHGLTAAGVWGAYAGQPRGRSPMSLIGTAMMSIGYLVLIYPPLAVAQSPSMTIVDFVGANPPFRIAGMLAVLGTMLLGGSIVRYRTYAAWTGVALIVCPVLFTVTLTQGLSGVIANVVNVIEAVALITIGMRALRPAAEGPG